MSVLLDALKKAAEEKKNADKSTIEKVDASVEVSNSETDTPDSVLGVSVHDSHNSESSLSTQAEDKLSLTLSPKFEASDETITTEESSSTEETAALLAALDSDETPMTSDSSSSSESQVTEESVTSEASFQNSSLKTPTSKNKEDFEWSMDDLPAYSETNETVPVPSYDSTAPLEHNPILTKGENAPPKPSKKRPASFGAIVSLFVLLMFIGIGFYGMLYYQEQSDKLELSMNKYALEKFEVASVKPSINSPSSNSLDSATNSKSNIENSNNQAENLLSEPTKDFFTKDGVNNNDSQVVVLNSNDSPAEILATESHKGLAKSPAQKLNKSTRTSVQAKIPSANKAVKNRLIKQDVAQFNVVTTQTILSQGYEYYSAQNYPLAMEAFNSVLQKDPKNKNALIGLGAISASTGDNLSAIGYYQRVLEFSPNNLDALEAIANLSGELELDEQWSRDLLDMANEYPDSSVLQYASGNIYAKENDWLQAQKHYFNAHSMAPNNPDYLLNLAISFDHLGKYGLAIKFYTQALGFAATVPINFDQSMVRDRLISIRQLIVKGH